MKTIFFFFRKYAEAFFWIIALLLLATMRPENTQASFCIWHHIGIDSCPGCGLGHSISNAFHGQLSASLYWHPMGIPAIIILVYRIFEIFTDNQNQRLI